MVQRAARQHYVSSIVVVIMMAIVAVVSPVPAVPIAWRSGIICIWIPGIWIVMDIRMPGVPVGIIIQVPRRTVVSARKSKTEPLSSGHQDGCGALSVRALGRYEGQRGYCQCD